MVDQFCHEEYVYDGVVSKCNQNCPKEKKTCLNKELAIEAKIFNADLNYKSELIRAKLDYEFKLWMGTDKPMNQDTYDKKFDWHLAHDMKCQFSHIDDQKFRFSSRKYQIFHTNHPVLMKVLDKEENRSLKEFIFGDAGMDFCFSVEFMEAKQEFALWHAKQIARTEKNANIEYDNFFTTSDAAVDYSLGFELDGCERMPLRDPFRM